MFQNLFWKYNTFFDLTTLAWKMGEYYFCRKKCYEHNKKYQIYLRESFKLLNKENITFGKVL